MKIYSVICAYNEEEKIESTVACAKKNSDKVIVVDDCSKDGTSYKAKSAGADIIIRHKINQGQGATIRHGLERAYAEGADIAVILDGDFQHDPNEIPSLVSGIRENEYDVVLGSRFLKNKKNMPPLRLLFNIIFSIFFRILFKFKVVDSQTGFRAFNRKAMEEIKLTIDRYDWTCEMADMIVRKDLKYGEVAINVRYYDKAHQANIFDGVKMFLGMLRFYLRN